MPASGDLLFHHAPFKEVLQADSVLTLYVSHHHTHKIFNKGKELTEMEWEVLCILSVCQRASKCGAKQTCTLAF